LIASQNDKAVFIENLGVDVLMSITATKDFLHLTPEEFVELLVNSLRPAYLIVGPNYHFGRHGAGTPEILKHLGERYGFEVIIHPAVYWEKTLVSSTTIRKFIHEGKVAQATLLLGRFPRFTGIVTRGDGRGTGLGFPTANLALDANIVIPGNGVYAVYVKIGNKLYKGAANIGNNPTFQTGQRRIEVFVMDFSDNLYGQTISIDFIHKLRNEQTFSSVDDLKLQIALDIKSAEQYFL
jgi:riboflavin kinase/FMN adenylyltransferase